MFASLLLAAALAFTAEDAKCAHSVAADLVRECTPRDAGTIRARLAASWLLDRVSRTGVDASIDSFKAPTPDGLKSFHNVIVEMPGEHPTNEWVVIASHYDTAPGAPKGFEGANDGASTSGLLVALAGAVKRQGRTKCPIAFVWTDGEECRRNYGPDDGFQGSRRAVEYFREKDRKVKAMLCLDMLGDRDLKIGVPAGCHPALRGLALVAAKRIGVEASVELRDDMVVKDDHTAFVDAGIPALDLIDFDYGPNNRYWHTAEDTMDKVSEASLLTSGRLAAELLSILANR